MIAYKRRFATQLEICAFFLLAFATSQTVQAQTFTIICAWCTNPFYQYVIDPPAPATYPIFSARCGTNVGIGFTEAGFAVALADNPSQLVENVWAGDNPTFDWQLTNADAHTYVGSNTGILHADARARTDVHDTLSCETSISAPGIIQTDYSAINLYFRNVAVDTLYTYVDDDDPTEGTPGYSFNAETDMTGSGLDKLQVEQYVDTHTAVANWNGTAETRNQVLRQFGRAFWEAIDSNGNTVIDRGFYNGWTTLANLAAMTPNPAGTANGNTTAWIIDIQEENLKYSQPIAGDPPIYKQCTGSSGTMTLHFRDQNDGDDHNFGFGTWSWGFAWDNNPSDWPPGNAPPALWPCCAGGPFTGNGSEFSGVSNINFLPW
jgi:hypothetical protein